MAWVRQWGVNPDAHIDCFWIRNNLIFPVLHFPIIKRFSLTATGRPHTDASSQSGVQHMPPFSSFCISQNAALCFKSNLMVPGKFRDVQRMTVIFILFTFSCVPFHWRNICWVLPMYPWLAYKKHSINISYHFMYNDISRGLWHSHSQQPFGCVLCGLPCVGIPSSMDSFLHVFWNRHYSAQQNTHLKIISKHFLIMIFLTY